MPTPQRPAGYVRVARPTAGPDTPAARRQRENIAAYAEQRGWTAPPVYTDYGPPGWDRPSELTRLADDIAAGSVDAVIVHDVARISRNTRDIAAFFDRCDQRHVPVYTTDATDLITAAPFRDALSAVNHDEPPRNRT